MNQDIKQIVAQEYIKCAKDPAYFMKKYCYIQHPKRGRILFNLYPFQENILHLFRDNQYIITLKSRQLGISTLAAGYSLWLMLFHKDKNILALATTQETARNLVTKVIFMYEELPKWLKLPTTENNKLSLRLKNGSRIKAKSSNTDAARSEAVSLLLIDEAAFIDNIEETFTAAQQTLACIDGRSLILTDSGLKRIKTLAKEEEGFNQTYNKIYNRNNELETSTHTYTSPLSKPLKVTFDNGLQHIVSKEHQLLNIEDEWIEARNLKIGEVIKGYYNQQSYNDPVDFCRLVDEQTNNKYKTRTTNPDISNTDIGYWTGLFIAEGSCSSNQVQIANGDSQIAEWLELLGFKNYKYETSAGYSWVTGVTFFTKLVKDVLEVPSGAKNKLVPNLILQGSKKQQIAFLQGLFDGDGHITPKEVGLTSTSNQLLQDVHTMLLNMGIQSRILKQTWKKNSVVKVESHGWRLTLRGVEAVKFKQQIGFRLERKQSVKLIAEFNPARTHQGKVIFERSKLELLVDSAKLFKNRTQFYRDCVDVSRFMKGHYDSITKTTAIKVLEHTDNNLPEWRELSSLITQLDTQTTNTVVSVEELQEQVTYDLKVPGTVSYIANGLVNHNTGGQCMALSTPNGVGNWFHKTWVSAEAQENSFLPIKLKWDVHPERDQDWREQQDRDLGPRAAAQECDCSFLASGNTVIEPETLTFYEESFQKEPVDRRGVDGSLWIWEYPDYSKSYIVAADVSRGDGADFSTFHIIETETCTQVAEFRSKLSPKEFGNILVGIASEYNDALLVVENANIGWATIEQILERGYKNLYYSTKSDQETVESYMSKHERSQLVPGFTTSMKSRPLIIAKLVEYIRDSSCNIKSKRLLSELRVFIWKNGKAQAQSGYNDDLVMAFAVALYVRDTALKLHQQGMDLTRAQMSSFLTSNKRDFGIKNIGYMQKNPYTVETSQGIQDISWVLK